MDKKICPLTKESCLGFANTESAKDESLIKRDCTFYSNGICLLFQIRDHLATIADNTERPL